MCDCPDGSLDVLSTECETNSALAAAMENSVQISNTANYAIGFMCNK